MYRLARLVGIPALKVLFAIETQGRHNIPRGAACVIIANHLNWLDSFAILMTFPAEPRIHFLADPELLRRRRLQWLMVRRAGGYVAVDRKLSPDLAMFDRVYRCLEVGGVVAIYPEGNYGPREGQVLALKKGFAHFAVKAGVPVVPVGLSGTQDLWLRKRVRVIIGEPIEPLGHDMESLVEAAGERLRALVPPYSEAPGRKLLRARLTNLF